MFQRSRLMSLFGVFVLACLALGAVVSLNLIQQPDNPLPTLMSLPSLPPVAETSPSASPSPAAVAMSDEQQVLATAPPTLAPTETPSETATQTASPTSSPVPSNTAAPPSPTERIANETATAIPQFNLVALPPQPVPGQIIVRFAPSSSDAERAAYVRSLGGTITQSIDALGAVVVNVPEDVASAPLPESPLVLQAEPDYFVVAQAEAPVNDPLFDQQWALPAIGAPGAWLEIPADAAQVMVAVIDSGVCADHPDLAGRILPGWDFVESDANPQDDFGHGCGVAGIIAANSNDGIGMAGVAPNAMILPLRVLNGQGVGTYSDVAAAIVYAVDNGAAVINLSLGGAYPSSVLESAIDYAVARDIWVIAAAGNTGGNILYPAAYDSVIAVGSVDADLQVSSFSARGDGIDIWAPGRDILTTTNGSSHTRMNGTSFAAPYVAGVMGVQRANGSTLALDGVVKFGVNFGIATSAPTITATHVFISLEDEKKNILSLFELKFYEHYSFDRSISDLIILDIMIELPHALIGYYIGDSSNLPESFSPLIALGYYVNGKWNILIRDIDKSNFNSILDEIPLAFLPYDSKVAIAFYDMPEVDAQTTYSEHYLPWTAGVSYPVTQRPGACGTHCNTGFAAYAWDFGIPNGNSILSSKGGVVSHVQGSNNTGTFSWNSSLGRWCTPQNSPPNYVVINHDFGASLYLHLKQNSIPSNIQVSQSISRATHIGGSGNVGYVCSTSNHSTAGTHLHYQVGQQSSSWWSQSGPVDFADWNQQGDNPTSGNAGGSCSGYSYNGVVFFENENCGGNKREFNSSGFRNLSDFNDKARSIHVVSGWSVRIWNDSNRGGASRCISGSMHDLNSDTYEDGSRIYNTANNPPGTVSSIEVFSNPSCSGSPPPSGCSYSYNGVALFDSTNCSGDKREFNSTGFRNLTDSNINFNDKSRSIHVAPNWSVRIWDGDNRTGSTRCVTGSLSDLNTQVYDDNYRIFNTSNNPPGTITSIEVFNSSNCPAPPPSCSTYSYNGVVFFENANCGGDKREFNSTGFRNLTDSNINFNDKSRAIHVAPNWSVRIWDGENRTGSTRCVTGSLSDLNTQVYDDNYRIFNTSNNPPGTITSIEVFNSSNCPAPPPSCSTYSYNGVVFFENANCGGDKREFNSGGFRNLSDHSFNDKARSIHVAPNWAVRIWNDSNRGGPTQCITHSMHDLNIDTYEDGSRIYNTSNNPPGTITSIEVYTNSSTCPPLVPNAPALNSPANNAVINRSDNITLSWNASSGATQYYAEFYGGPGVTLNSGWTSNTSWLVGAQWGGQYQWRVKARNSSGESAWSTTRSLTIKYGAPANLSATAASDSTINLTWNASADAPGNIDGYRIYRNGTAIHTVSSSTISYSNSGLTCATAYQYSVRAYKGTQESDASNNASATTLACPPATPDAPALTSPANNAVINRSDSITLSWNASSGATEYYAEFSGGPGVTLNSGWTSNTSWLVGAQWGGQYQWRVKARNSSGESAWSTTRSLTVKYGPPANLGAGAVSNSTISLTWSASADAPGNIDGYRIYRNGTAIHTVSSSTTIYYNSGLTCATTYQYSVRAYKGTQESDASNNASATTLACAPANDLIENASLITEIPSSFSVNVFGATSSTSDPTTCVTSISNTVWFKYTPTINHLMMLDTEGSEYDTVVAVYAGSPGNLSLLACNDDYAGYQSYLELNVTNGATYYILVGKFGASPLTGPASLILSATKMAANEKNALIALYNSTNGPNWLNKAGWLTSAHPCTWYGIWCENDHVVEIWLSENGLAGTLPPEVGNFTNLLRLDLSINQLTGTIPAQLGNLHSLSMLYLFHNQLSGSIPTQLSNLTALNWLNLSRNQLTGTIPAQLGNLHNLQGISLDYNQLSGSIPSQLGSLINLQVLSFFGNSLTGNIPFSIGNLSALRTLNLSANQLTGNIPAEIGNLSNVRFLSLGNNQLSGSIPTQFGNLTNLQYLYLNDCQLTGTIPAQLGSLTNLEFLWLSNNRLSGSIPAEIGNLTQLTALLLDNNQLRGSIPASLTNLVNLYLDPTYARFSISYNALYSTEPAVIAFLDEKAPGWATTQTTAPGNIAATNISTNSVTLSWDPILYTSNGGYYEVRYSTSPTGPFNQVGCVTTDKHATGCTTNSLQMDTSYYFTVRTFTPAHPGTGQQNQVWSDNSPTISAKTLKPPPTPTPIPTPAPPGAAPLLNYHNQSTVTLSWSRITQATIYEVQISQSPRFSGWVLPILVQPNTPQATTPVLANGTYYWRVRAGQPNGSWGSWSATDSFVVDAK